MTARGTPAFDPSAVLERYPAPIAWAFARLTEYPTPLQRLVSLKDLIEVTLKYCAILAVQDYLRLNLHSVAVDAAIARSLRRPQLGQWNEFLREIARCTDACRDRLFVPELTDLYFAPGGTPRRRAHEVIDRLIEFRNKAIAHGALAGAADIENTRRFDETLPLVQELLASVGFLTRYTLFFSKGDGQTVARMGAGEGDLPFTPPSSAVASLEPGRLYVAGVTDVLPLFPLLLYDRCVTLTPEGHCGLTKIFFFNGGARRKPEFLDYLMDHHKEVREIADFLHEIVSGSVKSLTADLESGIRLAARIIRLELLRERARGFVGRTAEEQKVLAFLSGGRSGLVTLVGDPGIGKSSLVAQLLLDLMEPGEADERSPDVSGQVKRLHEDGLTVAFHVCSAGSRPSIEVPRILFSLCDQLVAEYGEEAVVPAKLSRDQLLAVALAARQARGNRGRVLLVVDGIDEALAGRRTREQQEELLDALPLDGFLPDGVFVLVSARRGAVPEQREAVPGPAAFLGLKLEGLSRDAIRELLHSAGHKYAIDEGAIDAVLRASASNPLYVRLLADDLRDGTRRLEEIDQLPAGLEGYFEDLVKRFCADPQWPVLRDCLLLLALARSYLTVAQVTAATGLPWADVQRAVDGRLLSVLAEDETTEERDFQFFHERFREFILALFSGRGHGDVGSRLNRHLVENAPAGSAEGEVAAPQHLQRAREHLLAYCRRWREVDDLYPLRHLPAHLSDAGLLDELATLLQGTNFLEEKLRRLPDPFLASEDVRYLTSGLLAAGRVDDIVALGVTDHGHQRDGVTAALRTAGKTHAESITRIVDALLSRPDPAASQSLWHRLRGTPFQETRAIVNARRIAIQVATTHGLGEALLGAAADPSPTVRGMAIPFLYRFWRDNRDAGWRVLEHVCAGTFRWRIPNLRQLEIAGGLSLAILVYHFKDPDPTILDRLRRQWQAMIRRAVYLRPLMPVVVFALTRNLKTMMAEQPEFQPLNLREIKKSYSPPGKAQQIGLTLVEELERPERGFDATVRVLMDRTLPFDVYLMLLAERILIVHGAADPDRVLASLHRIHQDGCAWFRQSALYVSFHTLDKAAEPKDEWLQRYAAMTRETVSATQGVFRTAAGTYPLLPHMAWVEAVFEKHRPRGQARFIPDFFRDAMDVGDIDYARRVLRSCNILSLAYRRHALALDALKPALDSAHPALRDLLVEVLANIRFHEDQLVDRFLESQGAADFARRVASTTPAVKGADIPSWIDDFIVDGLVHGETFRVEMAGAFRRAGRARSPNELLQQVLKWGMNLIMGETVVAPH